LELIKDQIVLAPDNIEGDLAFPCFRVAKDAAKNPVEFAKDIAEKMNQGLQNADIFERFVAVGPYVNAIINQAFLAKHIIQEIREKKADYGR
jgi:arginyl-tRNA synthetase